MKRRWPKLRLGRFKSRAVESVSEKQRRRYFQHLADEDLWQVRPEIKKLVEFKTTQLDATVARSRLRLHFYSQRADLLRSRRRSRSVINNLLRALAVGGYLVVGPSEGIYDMLAPLKKISPFLYQKVEGSGLALAQPAVGETRSND